MIPRRNIRRAFHKAAEQPGYALRAFCQRFFSYLTYRLFDGYCSFPETISIFLTYQCNLRCKMCGQWGEAGSSRYYTADMLKQRLPFDLIAKLIDEVKGFRPNITLFGGEPLIYPEWAKVVRYVKSSGLRCNLITNGTLLTEYAGEVVDSDSTRSLYRSMGPKKYMMPSEVKRGRLRSSVRVLRLLIR